MRMSHNRGFRRDNRSAHQVGHYGGRSSGHQMNVNPWEGGMVPGNLGLLPTPPQASSLISQLSSPEAQLAIASNLLTTLLGPQQQQTQVPSLLSVNPLGQMRFQQSHFSQSQNRYQDRRRNRMEPKRGETSNKVGNRNRGTPSERKPGVQGFRTGKPRPGTSKIGNKTEKKDDKDTKRDEKGNGDLKNRHEDDGRSDGEEDEGKKRDWKEEKKPEEGEIVEDDDEEEEENEYGNKRGGKRSRYSGIPSDFLFCHVCKKHMWDDHSFDNHLKGRTHQLMMEKLDESYKIKVELMRHELKLAEQQREIEMERIKRQGKKVQMNLREYCTMCDLHFFGNIVVHRKIGRHQHLKNFLHPRCIPCGKEFPTRVEWDHHKLTPMHLRKTAEARKNRKPDSDDEFGFDDSILESIGGDIFKKNSKFKSGKDDKEDGEMNDGNGEDGNLSDLTIHDLRYHVPKYNPDVATALNLVVETTGYHCRICHRFFQDEDTSRTHCMTLQHYNNYISVLRMRARSMAAQGRRAQENKKGGVKDSVKQSLDEDGDDEGNWKRRKVLNEKDINENASSSSAKDGEIEEDECQSQELSGGDKYDPVEADAEDSATEADNQTPKEPEKNVDQNEEEVEEVNEDSDSKSSQQA